MRPISSSELGRLLLWAFLIGTGTTGFVLCVVAGHLGAAWFRSGWGGAVAYVFIGAVQMGVGMAIEELDEHFGGKRPIRSD